MPPIKRNSQGRYEKSNKDEVTPGIVGVSLPKVTTSRVLICLAVIFLMSPWILLKVRNNTFDQIKVKVSGFYENHFACSKSCSCTNTTTPEMPDSSKKNGF